MAGKDGLWEAPFTYVDVLGQYFKRAVASIGLPETRFHDLRYNYAEASGMMRRESQQKMERYIRRVSDL